MAYTINRTKIGTGETADVASQKAIPIYEDFHFPKNWAKSFDWNFWDIDKDLNLSILHGKVAMDSQVSLAFGLAGPSWAGTMELEGTVDNKELKLNFFNENFVSGMLIGAGLDFTFNFQIQYQRETFHFDWRHPLKAPWTMAWHNLLTIEKTSQFDLLTSLFNLAKLFAKLGKFVPKLSEILDVLPDIELPIPRTYNHGIADHISSSLLFLKGMEFPTKIELSLDFVELLKDVGEDTLETFIPELIPFMEIGRKLDKLLSICIKPSYEFGPVLGVSFITLLRLSGVNAYWNDKKYKSEHVKKLGDGLTANLLETPPSSAPGHLGIEFDHRPTISFSIGVYGKVTWLKILSLSGKYEISDRSLFLALLLLSVRLIPMR